MKKFGILVMIAILCCLPLTACNENNNNGSLDFIADELHCVISLPQEYDIIYDDDELSGSSMFDKDLYNADTVNGDKKKDGFRYYNVLKNEPFKIVTPLNIIQNKNESGQTLVYWKLNDTLYKDGDNYYSTNFSCTKYTEITPVYYAFRPVGMLLYEVDENDMLTTVQDADIFDDDGDIKEQSGVHYLYGVYDFEPNQEFWRTNLTINKYVINHTAKQVAENYYKDFYTLNIEIDKENLFENGKIIVKTLYKIDGHGYMTYGSLHVVQGDDTRKGVRILSIGNHEIKYTFT